MEDSGLTRLTQSFTAPMLRRLLVQHDRERGVVRSIFIPRRPLRAPSCLRKYESPTSQVWKLMQIAPTTYVQAQTQGHDCTGAPPPSIRPSSIGQFVSSPALRRASSCERLRRRHALQVVMIHLPMFCTQLQATSLFHLLNWPRVAFRSWVFWCWELPGLRHSSWLPAPVLAACLWKVALTSTGSHRLHVLSSG